MVLLGLGFVFMVAGARRGDGGALVSPWWLVAAYTFHTFGELCLSPIGLSLVTKLTPAKLAAVTMGLWFLSTGIAELLAGQIAAITDKVARGELFHLFGGQADFYFIFVALLGGHGAGPHRPFALAQPTDARSRFVKLVAAAVCLLLSSVVSGAPADPYRWLEDGDAPAVARWTEAQNTATRKALDPLPGRAALEERFGRLYSIGSLGAPVSRPPEGQAARLPRQAARQGASLLLHPPRRRAEPARPLRARRPTRATTARSSTSNALTRRRHERARLVVPIRRRPAARLRHCPRRQRGVAAPRPRRRDGPGPADDRIPRTRACSLAWLPDGSGLLLHALSRGRAGARRRGALPPRRLLPSPRRRSRARSLVFGDGRDRTDWPSVDLSPDGRWLVVERRAGLDRERGLPRRSDRPRRHRQPPSPWPPARTPASTSSRRSTIASTSAPTSGAPR